jgi:hypothetical protein
MTGEAAWILRMEHRIVRFAMAVCALWNVAMRALVAGNTGYSLCLLVPFDSLVTTAV